MTTRVLLLPAVTAGLLAATGCYGTLEPQKANEVPQAPAPRQKKTTAELLVGTWKMVAMRDIELPPEVETVLEYTADGKFDFRVSDWKNVYFQRGTGTYTVVGNTLRQTSDPDQDDPAGRTWDVTILSITETELVGEAGPADERERTVLKRVAKKS